MTDEQQPPSPDDIEALIDRLARVLDRLVNKPLFQPDHSPPP